MGTYRQAVYMIMDFLKISSDDAYYTPDHIVGLLNKFRAYVLKNKYENSAQEPDNQNFTTLSLPLEEVTSVDGHPCEGTYMRTKNPLPDVLNLGAKSVFGCDFLSQDFTWVSPQRFRFVGLNRWLKNQVYAAIGSDKRLYLKSCNPQLYYLECVGVRAIFADPEKAQEEGLVGDQSTLCEPLDGEFALEDNLLPLVMQYVVKELSGGLYKPRDTENNADDDLSTLAQFIRTYMKTPLRRQIES